MINILFEYRFTEFFISFKQLVNHEIHSMAISTFHPFYKDYGLLLAGGANLLTFSKLLPAVFVQASSDAHKTHQRQWYSNGHLRCLFPVP
jgi:hypothetical protein